MFSYFKLNVDKSLFLCKGPLNRQSEVLLKHISLRFDFNNIYILLYPLPCGR